MTSRVQQDVQHAIIDLIPDLRRFARSLTGSTDTANELVQTACQRVLSCPGALAAVEQPASWMFRIIRNLWIDKTRTARVRLSAPLAEGEHVVDQDVERASIVGPTLARVRAEMATLPEEQRLTLMLVCVEGLSYGDAAAELDIPIDTLMSRLCRGRLELARRIKSPAEGTLA